MKVAVAVVSDLVGCTQLQAKKINSLKPTTLCDTSYVYWCSVHTVMEGVGWCRFCGALAAKVEGRGRSR